MCAGLRKFPCRRACLDAKRPANSANALLQLAFLHRGCVECRSLPGKGMTTALIGKQFALAGKARVAWVSRHANSALAARLGRTPYEVRECSSWDDFAAAATVQPFDVVFCDEEVASALPSFDSPVFVLGDGSREVAGVRTLDATVLDSAIEPLVEMAHQLRMATLRCRDLESLVAGIHTGAALVGNSPIMRRLQGTISRAADCDATVLIEGPQGSGKSLVARVIHCKSRRVASPLMALSCGSLSVDDLQRAIENGRSTTLILEDIDLLPPAAQAQLVRHLKERATKGGAPRLIVTTAAHLPELVAKGAFREDLLYRLHAFPIVVPALRERVEDIASIATSFLASCALAAGGPSVKFTPSATMLLESMSWPGNVTQLEAAAWRARLNAGGAPIDREHLLAAPSQGAPAAGPTSGAGGHREEAAGTQLTEDSIRPFEEEEQQLLSRALRATKGNVRRAAQLLGIGRATLYRKIQQYHLRLQ